MNYIVTYFIRVHMTSDKYDVYTSETSYNCDICSIRVKSNKLE